MNTKNTKTAGKDSAGITRRQGIKLMGTAALTTSAALMFGCSPFEDADRTKLVTRLLKEKYNRDFVVVGRPHGFASSSKPNAYCREAADEDSPVFEVEFYAQTAFNKVNEEIISDTFVSRKLGRQVEDIITECFADQGIEVALLGAIDDSGSDPDINLDELIRDYGDNVYPSINMIISDSEKTPRSSSSFEAALSSYCDLIEIKTVIWVYIVKEADFEEFKNYFKSTAEFNGLGMPSGKMIDGFFVRIENSQIKIEEYDDWKNYSY
jgi:hypothetical protein